jgi:hypothetical protein
VTDILDGTVAEIKSTRLSVVEARALIEAEKAGKTRKGVIAHLEEIVASAPTAADETFIVTAKGAGRIQRRQGVFYEEGDEITGGPIESCHELVRRGLARLG